MDVHERYFNKYTRRIGAITLRLEECFPVRGPADFTSELLPRYPSLRFLLLPVTPPKSYRTFRAYDSTLNSVQSLALLF